MQIKDRWIFFLSTIIHTVFIGWLTYGDSYVPIFLASTISCLILMPIGYSVFWKFYETLNKHGILCQSRWERLGASLLIVEGFFLILYVITALAMIFIKDFN